MLYYLWLGYLKEKYVSLQEAGISWARAGYSVFH
jgi:hypothetical protein